MSRDIEPHISKDIFQEEIAAFMNRRETKNNLITVGKVGGVQYQFFHKVDGKTCSDEPIYTACID